MSTELMEKLVPRHLKPVFGLLLAVLGLAVMSGCGGPAAEGQAAGGNGDGGEISLVAYSTPKEAYGDLIPAFNKTTEGKDVKFTQSYGASGDQARAVESGLPADIVALSLAPDVDKLVEPGLVDADWAQDRYDGFVTDSVVVFAVRKCNLMAAYGSQIAQGRSPYQALDFLHKVLENTPVQDKSAREALQTFAGG